MVEIRSLYMPKGFSDEEKKIIRKKLLETGREFFEIYGIKKTNINEITKNVGIAKGSFYSFYDSKEALFLDVLEKVEKDLQQEMVKYLKEIKKNPKKTLKEFMKFHFSIRDDNPIIKELSNKETVTYLTRKMAGNPKLENKLSQYEYISVFIKNWQDQGYIIKEDTKILSGMLKALFTIGMEEEYRSYIGLDVYDEVIDNLIDIISDHLTLKKEI